MKPFLSVRCCAAALLLASFTARSQEWQAELMVGAANYNGDLTQSIISLRTTRPAVSVNVKYEFYYLVLRAGVSWAQLTGNDKFNKDQYIKNRRLDFRTNILEANVCAELNLVEPDIFFAYPYLFGGVGVMRYNPYTFDKDNNKTYLRPLSTEGQGLPEYPKRKNYSLTQVCLPLGAGWKLKLNKKWDIIYEFGYRILFTDYLDDVSSTYVSNQVLEARKGPKAAELALRATVVPGNNYFPKPGDMRGNSEVKDGYFFNGIKLLVHLGKED